MTWKCSHGSSSGNNLSRSCDKYAANVGSGHIQKESACYHDAYRTLNDLSTQSVDKVPQDLSGDDSHSQMPSPLSSSEPACASNPKRRRK